MMLVDTDHLSVLAFPESAKAAKLTARMRMSADPDFATTIVNVEEQMRGWLAELGRLRDIDKQIVAYDRLEKLVDFLGRWRIVPFDARAAEEFKRLRKQKVRISTPDLKIAAIGLVHGVVLLSGNLRDFRQVTGLQVESWLD